ncbi:MAG: hypothetical protein ACRCUI_14475 [Polymorphobacter sp.]
MSALLLGWTLRCWKPLVAGLIAVAALIWFNHAAQRRGAVAERRIWEARASQAAAAAARQALARNLHRDSALAAAAVRARRYANARTPIVQEVIHYVQSPAAAVHCPDAAGVRIGQASIDAANAATAAAR